MSSNQTPDEDHNPEQSTTLDTLVDGLKAIPPILVCTAGTYLLGFSGCISALKDSSESSLLYHLAAGSGLYGGFTPNGARKVISLVTLTFALVPEISMLAHGSSWDNIMLSAGIKAASYGIGLTLGSVVGGIYDTLHTVKE